MSGAYSGVQARIARHEPNAIYVHCAAHNLNLVLNDACSGIPEIKCFYDIVQKLFVFFSVSNVRWGILEGHISESWNQTLDTKLRTRRNTNDVPLKKSKTDISSAIETLASNSRDTKTPTNKTTLKRMCPTRWSSRQDAVKSLRQNYKDILKSLNKISLTSVKVDERAESTGLIKAIQNFEFVILVVMQHKLLSSVDLVSQFLQRPNINLLDATSLLEAALTSIKKLRIQFEDTKKSAETLAKSWGTAVQFKEKRMSRKKRQYDELCEDERLTDAEYNFKTSIFYACIDIVTTQLSRRFEGMNAVATRFRCIQPCALLTEDDDSLYRHAKNLSSTYEKDLSVDFPEQLLSFRSIMKHQIEKIPNATIKDMAELLIVKHSSIMPSVPDVATAFKIFLTLPVTVASAERSFSKLKLIKNYLRSTMSQERLSGLSILSIENERARKLNLSGIVKKFAEKNARRRNRFF